MGKILSILVMVCLIGCSKGPSNRALEFTHNVYSGKPMQAEEWLTRDTRASRLFNTFGGIDALIKDSVAEAKRNQGLQTVKLLNVKEQGNIIWVEIEVVFKNKEKSSSVNPWVIEDGKWKIAPVTEKGDNSEKEK